MAGCVSLLLNGTGWSLLAFSLVLSAPLAADLLPVLWGAVDSYIAIYQCSKNGGLLDSCRKGRFCHFQKTTAPVDWA